MTCSPLVARFRMVCTFASRAWSSSAAAAAAICSISIGRCYRSSGELWTCRDAQPDWPGQCETCRAESPRGIGLGPPRMIATLSGRGRRNGGRNPSTRKLSQASGATDPRGPSLSPAALVLGRVETHAKSLTPNLAEQVIHLGTLSGTKTRLPSEFLGDWRQVSENPESLRWQERDG